MNTKKSNAWLFINNSLLQQNTGELSKKLNISQPKYY